MSKKLKVNIDVWPRDGHSKEPDEPLEIHVTYGQNAEDEHKINSVQIESNTTVTYPSGKLLHPKEYCLKYHIYEEVQSLCVDDHKVLQALYGESESESENKYDIENKLFYNIGTGAFSSIFKNFPKQIAFEKADGKESSYRYLYKYEIISKKKLEDTLEGKKKIAEWKNVPIGDTLPQKPDAYYTALRSEKKVKVANDPKDEPGENEVMRYGAEPHEKSFGIKIELTVPKSNTSSHPVSIMKSLLDGVICAFHGEDEDGNTWKALEKRFEKDAYEKLWANKSDSWNLLGKQKYLSSGKGWNPADEADRLQFGWIMVEQGKDNKYKMSGEIYEWD